jgi:hypothetical protein
MKVKGRATLLFNSEGLHLEIQDESSSIRFLEIYFDEKQTCQLLSRLSSVECDMEIVRVELIGKKMEIDRLEFEIPDNLPYDNRDEILYVEAKRQLLKRAESGWIPDKYFNSQDSFFYKDNKKYARCTIRRWI